MEVKTQAAGISTQGKLWWHELQCRLLCVNHGCAEQKFLLLLLLLSPFIIWKRRHQKVDAGLRTNPSFRDDAHFIYSASTGASPGSTTARGGEAEPLSSCSSAFSMAWLKEFWKLGTGTRSEPSLSPSLSAAGGASSLSADTRRKTESRKPSGSHAAPQPLTQ